ncbi:MAG TPA: DNRLRE domain-containing protein, partial [Polyangium sp.]|nr:DNRLRE domain-containing protein [Polyangium sp.]
MTNRLRRRSPRFEFLCGALTFSTLTVGCGETGEFVDNDENVIEVAQGLTTVVLRGGVPGVTMEDTYITQASLAQTAGNTDRFYVNTNSSGARNVVGLVSWDLSSIPQGSTIFSATLKITTNQANGQAPEVHRVTKAWTEAAATWSSMSKGYDSEIIAQFPAFVATGNYVSKTQEITPLVQKWVSGDYPNDGLALLGAATPNLQASFYSSEVSVAAYAPELTIIFEPPFCYGKPNGTMCDDNDRCTQADTCQSGQCVGSNPVVCPSNTPCAANACNSATGTCSATALPDGSACNDGNLCTQSSRCFSGTCIGENPIRCDALDPCSSGSVCQPATGTCTAGTPLSADVQTGLSYRWTFDEASGAAVDMVAGANGDLTAFLSRT